MLSDAFGAFDDAMVLAALDTVDFSSSMEATEARALSSFSSGKELMVARWEDRGRRPDRSERAAHSYILDQLCVAA